MRKLILLDDYFPTGEATIQPALLWHGGKSFTDAHGGVSKHASEAVDYVKNVTPEPGKTIMLVLALGSEEAYGPNRNGDGFPERPVNARRGNGFWISPGEELPKHYRSFENGHVFQHHVNKDPAKASGYVKKAFWNPKMHRVELLIVVDNKKDPEWVNRVNDGDFPAVSMGCRIKYDVCSICGNKAPSRAQYCDHVKFDPGMNQLMPDGRRAYVHNPSPNFFDISRVFRPADKTGYTLKKVAFSRPYELISGAALGEAASIAQGKSAAIRKLSDIDKIVRGDTVASSSLPHADADVIRKFKDYATPRVSQDAPLPIADMVRRKPADVMATLSSMGVILTTKQMLNYLLSMMCPGQQVDDQIADRVVAMQGKLFEMFAESPALLDEVLSTGMLDEGTADPELAEKIDPRREKNSNISGALFRNLVPDSIGLRPQESPTTDLITARGPGGQPMATDRGAAVEAHDRWARDQMMTMLGGAALLSAAYGVTSANPALRKFRLPIGVGAAAGGYAALKPGDWKKTPTDSGDVPAETEFAPAQERTAAFVLKLVKDYREMDKCAGAQVASAVKHSAFIDEVVGPVIDMDSVAARIGELLTK